MTTSLSLGALGALAGLTAACGVLLIVSALRRRRPTLEDRLAPYVHDQPATSGLLGAHAPDPDGRPGSPGSPGSTESTVSSVLLATIGSAGYVLEGLGSSAESVRHRLSRAGNALTYEQLRLQQLLWAASAFAFTIGAGLLASMVRHVSVPLLAVSALVALVGGAACRDWWLSREVERRRRRIEIQLPDVVELLALVVGAGQGPVAAIERVVDLGRGELIDELALTLADVRSGTVLTSALTRLEGRVDSLHVTRLSEAISVALERGTPLADVMRAQAADAREASRRALMEEGGRREIAQMVPVVFLVLPITVVFALFPGLFVLRLGL